MEDKGSMSKEIVDIVFIILHYIGLTDTTKCIESIKKKVDTERYRIILVDNHSPNNTFDTLDQMYKNDATISVIKTKENLGFANGNNYGLIYARKKYTAKYYVLSNNDVILIQTDLLRKLDKEYERSKFAVLGPMILSVNGKCDFNPIRTKPWTKAEIDHYIKGKKLTLLFNCFGLAPAFEAFRRVKHRRKNNFKNFFDRQEDVELFGCFLVISEDYFEKFDGLDGRTFLFAEEDILYTHVIHAGMKMVYLPEIAVFHNEDSSINIITRTKRKKIKFMCEYIIKSMNILRDIICDYEMR